MISLLLVTNAPINVMPPLPHTRAEVGEGGDLHLRKIQIPTYWGSCPCIIPGITPHLIIRVYVMPGAKKEISLLSIKIEIAGKCTNPHYLGES